jgi:hypothetical protein
VTRLLVVALFFEVGAVLFVVPWSGYWQHNYFIEAVPYLEAVATNNFVKGAISGLGLVNLLAGLAEFGSLFASDRSEISPPVVTPPAASEERP